MLGNILGHLTNATAAEQSLAAIADEALLERVKSGAAENGVSPGTYVSATVRHLLDYGDEEVWLDLIGKMANSPQPGAVALQAILARAFPEAAADARCGHGQAGHSHRPSQEHVHPEAEAP
jgi:hypothetical protein